jgi:hypothetical protein
VLKTTNSTFAVVLNPPSPLTDICANLRQKKALDGDSSFRRRPESRQFKCFWTPVFTGVTALVSAYALDGGGGLFGLLLTVKPLMMMIHNNKTSAKVERQTIKRCFLNVSADSSERSERAREGQLSLFHFFSACLDDGRQDA